MEVIDGFLIWTWVFISDLVFAWAVADLSSDCAYAQVFQALVGLFGLFSEAESMPRCGVCKSESSRFTWLVLSRSFLTLLDIVEFYNYGLKSPKIIPKLVNHEYNSRLLTFILLSFFLIFLIRYTQYIISCSLVTILNCTLFLSRMFVGPLPLNFYGYGFRFLL